MVISLKLSEVLLLLGLQGSAMTPQEIADEVNSTDSTIKLVLRSLFVEGCVSIAGKKWYLTLDGYRLIFDNFSTLIDDLPKNSALRRKTKDKLYQQIMKNYKRDLIFSEIRKNRRK